MRFKKKRYDKNRNNVDDRLEFITNLCAVALPLSTLPQLYQILWLKNADGVSSLTWGLYTILTLPLLMYGIQRKDTTMIILQGLWIFIDGGVWIGSVLVHKGII